MEDKLLVYRLKAGSEDALKRIYEKYENYLFAIAVNLLHDNAAADYKGAKLKTTATKKLYIETQPEFPEGLFDLDSLPKEFE